MIHLDTSFIVDLVREAQRGEGGPETRLLRRLESEELAISTFVLCELRAGAEMARNPISEHETVDLIEETLSVASADVSTAVHYGHSLALLRRRGEVIATMDLLIASVSLAAGASLVTRNRKHFDRVPGLKLIDY